MVAFLPLTTNSAKATSTDNWLKTLKTSLLVGYKELYQLRESLAKQTNCTATTERLEESSTP